MFICHSQLRFSVVTNHISDACSIGILSYIEYRLWVKTIETERSWDNDPRTRAACDYSQLTTTPKREHATMVAKLWDDFKLAITEQHLPHRSFINLPCIVQASGSPRLRVLARWAHHWFILVHHTASIIHNILHFSSNLCLAEPRFIHLKIL